MTQQKFNMIARLVFAALVGWVAGNLWEGRRTDRVCETAYELMGLAQLNARGQMIFEDLLARDCEPAELSSTFD
jgi:hypothetical protein